MPVTDATIWREIAGWFVGIAATIATAFWILVTKWANHRFENMGDRIDEQDERIAEHDAHLKRVDKELADQHEKLSVLQVHMENGAAERKRIEDGVKEVNGKLDKLLVNK